MLEELFTYAKLSSQSYEITSEKCCINQILRDKELSSLLSKVQKRIFNRRKKVTSNRHKRARR